MGVGGVMAISKALDYILPYEWKPEAKRDLKLHEYQRRLQAENQAFQAQRDEEQRRFQLDIEAQRMNFQERVEMRRLEFQARMEASREALQRELQEMNIKNSHQLAKFQAIAMRETQILVSRENAQNLLYDHMVQDALRSFPLNISPLVLLKNRPHSLSSLLRFSVSEGAEPNDANKSADSDADIRAMIDDVRNYARNPEPLNIFVAPVYVDSKIRNRKVLSDQIWDTTYLRIESFFTEHYNRRGDHPVVFYPTAWNDKYSAGMHASETLHFFLRDMPCIVLEPRFDGRNFRLMISTWGLGYTTTEHIRTELNFEINIDSYLARAVYDRSVRSQRVLEEILKVEMPPVDRQNFAAQYAGNERNIRLYEALRIPDKADDPRAGDIDALGLYKIFKIEPIQDLEPLAQMLSAQIGMTLAALADIHHLRSTRVNPLLPQLMKPYFPELFANRELRKGLYDNYCRVLTSLGREDKLLLLGKEEQNAIKHIVSAQEDNILYDFDLLSPEEMQTRIERKIRSYAEEEYHFRDADFSLVCDCCCDEMTSEDISFFKEIVPYIGDEALRRRFERAIERKEQHQ